MPPVPGSVPFRVTSGTEKNGRGVLGKDAAVKVRASLSRQDFSDKNEKSLVLCNGRYKSRRDGGCLGFRREPRCPLRCWKSQKASRRGSRSAGLGRQDLGARDASPATVCLNTSGCFFRQFLFTVFIDWRGEGSASALPPAGSLSSPAGPRARHCGKLLLLRPRQGKVRRCCQSGRLAPGESEQEVPTGGRTNCQPEGTACQKLGLPRAAETPGQKRDTQQPARESEGQLRTGPHARRQPRRGRCESEPRAAPRRALETFQKALPRASGLSPPEFSPRRGQGDRRHLHCTLGKKRLTWEHGVT